MRYKHLPKFGREARGIDTEQTGETEKKQRIEGWMAACLVTFAGSVDLFQALLTFIAVGVVLAPVISVGVSFILWLWLSMLGVSFITSPKRLATMTVQAVAEIIPGLDALPVLTVGVILLIIITRSEDKGGIIGKVADAVPIPKR